VNIEGASTQYRKNEPQRRLCGLLAGAVVDYGMSFAGEVGYSLDIDQLDLKAQSPVTG